MTTLDIIKKPWVLKSGLFLLVAGFLAFSAYRYTESVKAQRETEIKNMTRQFEIVINALVQANNTNVKKQEELLKGLSEDYKKSLKEQEQKILARVDGTIQTQINPISTKLWELQPGVFSFPAPGESHPIVNNLNVNTVKRPASFDITFKPQEIKFTSTLNFSEKDNTMSFWSEPKENDLNGMTVKISRLELQPSAELNKFITDLRGKKAYLPVMPKHTVMIHGGIGTSLNNVVQKPYFGGTYVYNFTNQLGVGGTGLTNGDQFIILATGAYSFGKR